MAFSFIISYLLLCSLGIVFSFCGACLLNFCLKSTTISKGAQLVVGYFLGVVFFISTWRLFEFVLGSAKVSSICALIISAVLAFHFASKNLSNTGIFFRKVLILIPLNLAAHIFCTTFWSRDGFADSFSTIGSGHSPRFANIALYLVDNDRIPILGMNYAQSLLAAVPSFLGVKFPLLFLSLWLGLSLFMLVLLSYHLFRFFGLGKTDTALSLFFVFLGNTALSFSHVLVLDLGSPIAVLGYADSLHSIGSLIVSAILLCDIWQNTKFGFRMLPIFTFFFILFANIIMAPQIMVVVLGCIGLLFLYSSWKIKENKIRFFNFTTLLCLALLCVAASIRTGGFITPSKYHETAFIPGVQKIEGSDFRLNFSPSIPYYLGNYMGWGPANEDATFFRPGETTSDQIQRFFNSVFEVFKILFFPVFGLILFSIYGRSLTYSKEFIFLTSVAFLAGFCLVWPVALCDTKWPQTRFLLPFIYLGQTLFIVSIYYLLKNLNSSVRRATLAFFTVLASWGPVKNIYPVLQNNLALDRLGYQSRLKILVEYTTMPTTDQIRDPFVCHKK